MAPIPAQAPPQPQQPASPLTSLPPIIKWGVALLVIGGTAEWLNDNVSPTAGYGLVAIVVLAYASFPTHITAIDSFFNTIFDNGRIGSGQPVRGFTV